MKNPTPGILKYIFGLIVFINADVTASAQASPNPTPDGLQAACTAIPQTTVTDPTCTVSTGSIRVDSPVGPNYQYSINMGAIWQFNPVFANVAAGTYLLRYRDTSINCVSADKQITVTASAPIGPPTPVTPVFYCQGDATSALTATPSAGATLRWYTAATGGSALPSAPVPSSAAAGLVTYYVSQTNGICESTREEIEVFTSADNGAQIVITCYYHLVNGVPNVYFDWNNPPGFFGYNYTYTVNNGAPVTGFIRDPSHIDIPVSGPGIPVSFTITEVVALPCIPPVTDLCNCANVNPDFTQIQPLCEDSTPPVLPATSNNGYTGSWSPPTINTANPGTFSSTFTPNAVCGVNPYTMNVIINPKLTPAFNQIAAQCVGAVPPALPATSINGVTGVWSPSSISTAAVGSFNYVFTPTAGQCVTGTVSMSITVNAVRTPDFNLTSPICSGDTDASLLSLPLTSPNGISGTWNFSSISNTIGRTYIFTPTPGQCANSYSKTITITPRTIPNFANIPAFCSGTTPIPVLNTTSPNGVTGIWSPSVIDNTLTGSYIFSPDLGQCAAEQILIINVIQPTLPDFEDFSLCDGSSAMLEPVSPNGISGTWAPAIIDSTVPGTYAFTPDAGQCALPATISVTINRYTLQNVRWEVSDAFADSQTITVLASLGGNYLYQLDNGPKQQSPVFENVEPGSHTVIVYDANGCDDSITRSGIIVSSYPNFFTPNADGFNDTWNIIGFEDQPATSIYIFDRMGKLLKQISPAGSGWDGTYNGKQMPATDYWFRVEYSEKGNAKKFSSHFSLKR